MKIYNIKTMIVMAGVFAMAMMQSCKSDDAATLGGSPEENEKVFLNMVEGGDDIVAVSYMDLDAFINKSGIKNDPQMGTAIENFAPQLGLNLSGKVLVGVEGKDPTNMKFFAMFHLDDADKFKGQAGTQLGGFEEANGFEVAKIEGQNMVLAVNENFGLLVGSSGFSNKEDTEKYIAVLFDRGAKETEAGDVKSFVGAGHDFGFTFDNDKAANLIPWDLLKMTGEIKEGQVEELEAVIESARGGWTTMGMAFEKGSIRIEGETQSPMASGAGAMLKEGGVSQDFENFLTNDNKAAFFMTGAFNLKSILGMVENFATEKDLEEMNIFADLITNVFTGEIAVSLLEIPDGMEGEDYADVDASFSDLNDMDDDMDSDDDMDDMESMDDERFENMIVTFGINDKSAIVRVLDTVAKMQESDIEGVYEIADKGVYYVLTKDKFVVTGNKLVASTIASKGGLSSFTESEGNLSNSVYGALFFEALKGKGDLDRSQEDIIRLVEKMTFKVNGGKAVLEFHLTDDSVNALELIVTKAMTQNVMSFM